MTPLDRYKLVPVLFSVGVQFSCQNCDRPITIKLDDLEGPFTCRGCEERIAVPSISCVDESCDGTYVKCRGTIEKLSGRELEEERSAAWEGESRGGRPTDSDHDDYRDVEGSVISYRCASCGAKYTARYATSQRFDDHGRKRCERAVCGKCKRAPTRDDLP